MEENKLLVSKVVVFDENIQLEYDFTQDEQEQDMRGDL